MTDAKPLYKSMYIRIIYTFGLKVWYEDYCTDYWSVIRSVPSSKTFFLISRKSVFTFAKWAVEYLI